MNSFHDSSGLRECAALPSYRNSCRAFLVSADPSKDFFKYAVQSVFVALISTYGDVKAMW
jgi:hypothetical protein